MGKIAIPTALALAATILATGAHAEDPEKKACMADARRLCPQEVHALARKRVETCLNARVEQTTPVCHAMILKVRAERAAAPKRP